MHDTPPHMSAICSGVSALEASDDPIEKSQHTGMSAWRRLRMTELRRATRAGRKFGIIFVFFPIMT
jgi:hypothetical protein